MRGIYCIEHINSGRKYYGSSKNIKRRLTGHRSQLLEGVHHNLQLQRAVNKYGIEAFTFGVVEETPNLDALTLLEYEQKFIDSNAGGYNMAPANGGDTLSNHPYRNEIRKRINDSHKTLMLALGNEGRKIRWSHIGDTNFNWKGGSKYKVCPTCLTNKIRHNSKSCSECRDRSKENNPFFNKHHSEKTKQYLREINSGDNSWIKGIDPAKLSYTKSYQITYSTGESKIVAGLKIIADEFNVSIENIHATIKRISQGKVPTRGKLAGIVIEVIK